MHTQRTHSWRGLYALFALLIGMMVLDVESPLSETWHDVLLAGIVILISILTIAWVERNPRLVERSGINSRVTYRVLSETANRRVERSESSKEDRA